MIIGTSMSKINHAGINEDELIVSRYNDRMNQSTACEKFQLCMPLSAAYKTMYLLMTNDAIRMQQ